jgi:hypothetical protein
MPSRPPEYAARQGYVKPLWRVVLRRHDTRENYIPADEAYNLPAIGESLESDKYSVAKVGSLSLELARTPELVDFLSGLAEPERLSLKIVTYHLFCWKHRYAIWYGLLRNLPEGEAAYAADKLRLTFVSCPGAWEDGDEVKDPDTGTWYKNKHVHDVLLPAFIKEGRAQAGSGTYVLEEPAVRGDAYFWSGTELPRKCLAARGVPYDDTYQVKSLCWDSKRELLYMGVRDGVPGTDNNPWLVSYNPATREWIKVCRFKYAGPRDWRKLGRPTEWEVLHLEYDAAADKVWYVCQTTHANLCDPQAHYKCYGSINMADAPKTVDLVEGNLFTLHNKGFAVRSKPVSYDNYGQGDNYAYGLAQTIGWGTPNAEKECGAMHVGDRRETTLYENKGVRPGSDVLPIQRVTGGNRPRPGDFCEVHDELGNRRQSFGEVVSVSRSSDDKFLYVKCEKRARYYYRNYVEPLTTNVNVYFYKGDKVPDHNVFIGKPQTVTVEFLHADGTLTGLNAPDPVDIVVEHKHYRKGREQFYWPRKIGEISEDGETEIDVTGFVSFISMRDLSLYNTEDETEYYCAWNPAPFRITFEGYHASFLLADGFSVHSSLQDHGDYGPYRQPGKCRVVKDGKTCEMAGGGTLSTYGDIFLFKYGSRVYAAWNDHACDAGYNRFPQCKLAVWEEAKSRFRRIWVNRKGERWWVQDVESYITSAIRHRDRFYLGRRYYGRNWIDTGVKVFWAAPPQTNMGVSVYDGGIVAMAAVKGDKSEVFEAGDVIRFYVGSGELSNRGLPGKEYVISEVQTFEREITPKIVLEPWLQWQAGPTETSTEYLADGEGSYYKGEVTLLSILSIEPYMENGRTYSEQIGFEVRGKYISVAKGRDERHQIMELLR